MTTVMSSAKSVKVFKAPGIPVLRLFPGMNNVKSENFEKYFDGNIAAQSVKKEFLSVIESGALSPADKIQANASREKNDALNKANRIIKKNETVLASNSETMKDQQALIESQGSIIDRLSKRLDDIEASRKK